MINQIKELRAEQKFDEALLLASDLSYYNDFKVQYEKAMIFLDKNELKKAYEFTNNPRFLEDENMQEALIMTLIRMHKYKDAYEIASNPKYKENYKIQTYLAHILIKLQNYNEAYEIASDKKYSDYAPMQFELITVLLLLGRRPEAEYLALNPKFENDDDIQFLLIVILIQEYRYKKAYSIARQKRFKDHKRIQKRLKYLKRKLNIEEEPEFSDRDLIETLRNIKERTITELEIETLELSTIKKKLLLILFYYQNNYPLKIIIKSLKQLEFDYEDNKIALQTIKYFLNFIKQKQAFFDIDKFYNYLKEDFEEEKISR